MTYRWVEHTGELELQIEAQTEEEVFAEALAAFAELVGNGQQGEIERRRVAADASDRAALLAQWLEELVFLAETEDFVPERLASLKLGDRALLAEVDGRQGRPPHLVKGVTYHRLELAYDGTSWRARAILDV